MALGTVKEARGSRMTVKLATAFVSGIAFSQFLAFGGDPATYYDNFLPDIAATSSVPPDRNPIASVASTVVDINVQEAVTVCTPITPEQTAALKSEIRDYEASKRFTDKLDEVQGKTPVAAHHVAIEKYLREKVLQEGWSVLELGCAAGMMLQLVKQGYEKAGNKHKEFVGVELVTGWVKFAQAHHTDIQIFEGE